MKLELSGSILGANPLYLGQAVTTAYQHGLKRLHIDIMDGNYVPNISFGSAVLPAIQALAPMAQLDVHLMVNCPENLVAQCLQFQPASITIHPQACKDPKTLIQTIKAAGCVAGIAINPCDDLSGLLPYLDLVDLVTVMTVNPGACGQKLIAERLELIPKLREHFKGNITIDGGVNADNCQQLSTLAIDRLVAGSAIFSGDIAKNISKIISNCK